MSLRESAAAGRPKSSGMHLPSFGLSKGNSGKASRKSKSHFSSRLADSSDEDGDAPATFRSRFYESSDEDDRVATRMPAPTVTKAAHSSGAAPAVKSPLLPEEVDPESSELPDSSDEERAAANTHHSPKPPVTEEGRHLPMAAAAGSSNIGTGAIRRSRSGRGSIGGPAAAYSPVVAGGSWPSRTHRRGNLMSVLRRKKGDDGKIHRGELMDSFARLDTKLERSPEELEAIRGTASTRHRGTANTLASGPRLQKRVASVPTSVGQPENWPLPGPGEDDVDEGADKGAQRPAASSMIQLGRRCAVETDRHPTPPQPFAGRHRRRRRHLHGREEEEDQVRQAQAHIRDGIAGGRGVVARRRIRVRSLRSRTHTHTHTHTPYIFPFLLLSLLKLLPQQQSYIGLSSITSLLQHSFHFSFNFSSTSSPSASQRTYMISGASNFFYPISLINGDRPFFCIQHGIGGDGQDSALFLPILF